MKILLFLLVVATFLLIKLLTFTLSYAVFYLLCIIFLFVNPLQKAIVFIRDTSVSLKCNDFFDFAMDIDSYYSG